MDFVVRVAYNEVVKVHPEAGFTIKYCNPNEVSPREFLRKAQVTEENRIAELLYVGDQAIFTESVEELQDIFQIYNDTHTCFGLQMLSVKTETRAFSVDKDVESQDYLYWWQQD